MILYRWVSANRVIVTNASSLVTSQLVTSLLGFVYWWLAARQFTASSVGLASASISAMTLLGTASVLGLGTLLLGEIPRQPDKVPALIMTGLVVSGTAGLIAGLLFALIAPLLSPDFSPLAGSLGSMLVFALGVGLTSATLVLDQAVIGLLRGGLQLWRNIVFALTKLFVLMAVGVFVADRFGMTIYSTWVIGGFVSLAFLAVIAIRTGAHTRRLSLDWYVLRKLGKDALGHHALNIALQIPSLTLPVLVTILLSASANAHFYIAWMIAAFVFVGPYSLTTVLFAVTSTDPVVLAQRMRHTLLLSVLVGLAEDFVLILGATFVLDLFGHTYAEQADWALRIMVLGVFPLIVRNHFVAVSRVYGYMTRASLYMIAGGALELTAASIGAVYGGLIGLTLGWLGAVCIEAILMSRTVYRAAMVTRESEPNAALRKSGRVVPPQEPRAIDPGQG